MTVGTRTDNSVGIAVTGAVTLMASHFGYFEIDVSHNIGDVEVVTCFID